LNILVPNPEKFMEESMAKVGELNDDDAWSKDDFTVWFNQQVEQFESTARRLFICIEQ